MDGTKKIASGFRVVSFMVIKSGNQIFITYLPFPWGSVVVKALRY